MRSQVQPSAAERFVTQFALNPGLNCSGIALGVDIWPAHNCDVSRAFKTGIGIEQGRSATWCPFGLQLRDKSILAPDISQT